MLDEKDKTYYDLNGKPFFKRDVHNHSQFHFLKAHLSMTHASVNSIMSKKRYLLCHMWSKITTSSTSTNLSWNDSENYIIHAAMLNTLKNISSFRPLAINLQV
jgi:hypothetical protein